jgi:DNA-binding CsgD family transcriptional regulator
MLEPSGPEALICSLYDAALTPSLWEPIAGQLARTLRSASAAIQIRTKSGVQVLSRTSNFTDDDAEAYRSYFFAKDVLAERASARDLNQILTNSDLISDAAWVETEIYRDYFVPLGIHFVAGGMIELAHSSSAIFAVHRDKASRAYDAEDKSLLARLLPHFRNAIRVQNAVGGASLEFQAARDFLERSTTALLVVDRTGRLLTANSRGEMVLERSLALTLIAGKVTAAQLSAHCRMMRLIEAAVDAASGRGEPPAGMLSVPFEHQTPLSVTITTLRARQGFALSEPAAVIIIRDAGERVDITHMLTDLYGLTPSEALLATGLVNGLTVEEVALAHGVTLNTVRTQLKSVMTKTVTSRQTELVALILRSLAGQI